MFSVNKLKNKYLKKTTQKVNGIAYDEINASKCYAKLQKEYSEIQRNYKGLSFLERCDLEKIMSVIEKKKEWHLKHTNFDIEEMKKYLKE